jgi:hypothetical protein
MKWITRVAAVAAVGAAAVYAARRAVAVRSYGRIPTGLRHGRLPEWLVVTVNIAPAEVTSEGGRLPEPLRRLGEAIEVQIRPAPGDRGAELRARPRAPEGAQKAAPEAWRGLRVALRHSKQLLETGEILRADQPANRETVTSRPLAYALRHAHEEGRL